MPDRCLTPVSSLAITNVVVEGVMMPKQEELATRKDLKKLEDRLTAKIDANAAKIDANSQTLSRLTSLVLDNGERMATKENMNKRLDEIVSGIDGLARSFSILQQERVVINKRLDRIEARLA